MKSFFAILAIVSLIALAGFRMASPGGFWGYKYEATAVVQVHSAQISIAPNLTDSDGNRMMARGYMESEFETPTTDPALLAAIEVIALDLRWNISAEEALERLRPMVSSEPIRGTDFIKFKVQSDLQEDANDIVNAVTECYIDRKNRTQKERAQSVLEALDTELARQEAVVLATKSELKKWGVPYDFERGSGPSFQTEEGMYRLVEKTLEQLKGERDEAGILLEKLISWTPDFQMGIHLPENQVEVMYEEYLALHRKIDDLTSQGLGSHHPSVAALKKQANQVLENTESLANELKKRIELIDQQVQNIEDTALRRGASSKLNSPVTRYHSAKAAYEQAKDLLRKMKVLQTERRHLLKNQTPLVTRHE